MRIEALKEALKELETQRDLLTTTINDLRAVIEATSGASATLLTKEDFVAFTPEESSKSYIDYAVEAIRESGKGDLHIKKIAEYIETRLGRTITRATVEATLSNHIKSMGENTRVIRTEPAHYGLPPKKEP